MTEAPGVIALRAYRAEQSKLKRQRVVEVIAELRDNGMPVSVTGVARSASVSREFIYSHQDLVTALRRAQSSTPPLAPRRTSVPAREAALLAERQTFIAKIEAQQKLLEAAQESLSDLEKQRERWMGAQLDQMMQPARVTELVSENEQLTRRLIELTKLTDAQERSLRTLQEELRISRLAHSETAAELDDSRRVIPIRPSATRSNDSS